MNHARREEELRRSFSVLCSRVTALRSAASAHLSINSEVIELFSPSDLSLLSSRPETPGVVTEELAGGRQHQA
jgi:hypothetical protein